MTTAAARRAAEEKKVGSFLDAMRRPDSRAGKLTPPSLEPDTLPSVAVSPAPEPAAGPSPATQESAVQEAVPPPVEPATAPPSENGSPEDPKAEAPAARPQQPLARPATGRETETVIRVPATMDDVFAQLETPWEPRDRLVLVRSYSMDPVTTEMLKELHEIYGVDMSTLVRQAVKGLYVEARRRRRLGGRLASGHRKAERREVGAGAESRS